MQDFTAAAILFEYKSRAANIWKKLASFSNSVCEKPKNTSDDEDEVEQDSEDEVVELKRRYRDNLKSDISKKWEQIDRYKNEMKLISKRYKDLKHLVKKTKKTISELGEVDLDELEVLEFLEFGIPRQINQRINYFDVLDEVGFRRRFRLLRDNVLHLIRKYKYCGMDNIHFAK
ncbi:hypothetical protein FQR65_LT16683 [Abscondita terminalis]|nr:hypothetical protein FQR65_LT16683 [Abscondita terminalis]